MRVLVAPDKFKGSLGAAEVADAIAVGLRDVLPNAEIQLLPIADGGEGTASVICAATKAEWHSCEVHDPLGHVISASYATIADGITAVMEMSEASGLWRVPSAMRDPLVASTFGTGELLLAAASHGAKEILIGLGGSATNDGGFGMARALGFRFLNEEHEELTGPVSDLIRLMRLEWPKVISLPQVTCAADVRNHLLGDDGATRVFGPQKNATPDQIEMIERALSRLGEVVARDLGVDYRKTPGAGAAGGLGFGLLSFCRARLRSGFEVVAECIGLETAVREADVIITGEGHLDAQTLKGKAPAGLARLARKHRKRCFAIVGHDGASNAAQELFDEVIVLARAPVTIVEAMKNAEQLLRARARELAARLQDQPER